MSRCMRTHPNMREQPPPQSGEDYGSTVRVVRMGELSAELCGGTHVDNTAALMPFKIISENSSGAGVRQGHPLHLWQRLLCLLTWLYGDTRISYRRRIEAVAGEACVSYFEDQLAQLQEIGSLWDVGPQQVRFVAERWGPPFNSSFGHQTKHPSVE